MAQDWSKGLERVKKQLSLLKHLPEVVQKEVASELEDDLATTFAAGQDPYGVAWAPRKGKQSNPILDKTGRLKASRRSTIKADGEVEFSYDDPVASYHQDGTKALPVRLLVPTETRGLPTRWKKAISDAIAKALSDVFGG